MIKDLIKLKIPSVTCTLSFNVLLHVTILFTILSIFFIKYVNVITTKIINKEINHIVSDSLEKLNDLGEKINLDDKMKNIGDKIENIGDKIENINDKININDKLTVENIKKMFPYDYYVKLFSKEDVRRKSINDEVFFYIKFTNILLILFLVLFAFYLVRTKSINAHQIKEICIENVLTFILVGGVEFLFFTNVALKYIPTKPSLLFTSLIEGLKN